MKSKPAQRRKLGRPPAPTPTAWSWSTLELAQNTGITDRWIRDLVRRRKLPSAIKGRHPMPQTLIDLITHYRTAGEVSDGKTRGEAARADFWELKVEQRKGELMQVDDVIRHYTRMVTSARARLLTIPPAQAPRLAMLTDAVEVEQALSREIRNALEEMKAWKVAPVTHSTSEQPTTND